MTFPKRIEKLRREPRNQRFMRNLKRPGKHMCSRNILCENGGSRDETWDDARFKSSARKILCGHRIRGADHPYPPTPSALKHLFQKGKNKKKTRSPFLTFMNMQSWSTLHGLPDSQAQEESTCVYIGIPGGNVLGNMYARTRPPRSACEMRRLDKKCIFGPPEGPRRRLCISRLFSALFSLPPGKKSRRMALYKYKLQQIFALRIILRLPPPESPLGSVKHTRKDYRIYYRKTLIML